MEKDYKIWVTYHRDELPEQFDLREDDHHRLFASHKPAPLPNINAMNTVLSEMVTMWYVWHNDVKSKWVGFEHYRRHLRVDKLPRRGECIIYTEMTFPDTIYQQYGRCHHYNDMESMLCILDDYHGKGNAYSRHILESRKMIANCTFLMMWKNFEELCEYLFPLLTEFGRRNIQGYNEMSPAMKALAWFHRESRGVHYATAVYQTRILSFLAERLISAWINTHMTIIQRTI